MQEPETVSFDEISKQQVKLHRHRLLYFVILVAGVCFFGLTSPRELPLPVLLISFLVAGGMLFSAISLVLITTALDSRLSDSHRRAVTGIVVVLPVLLLMLQSIGQLTIRDVITLCLLFGIGFFYFERILRRQR